MSINNSKWIKIFKQSKVSPEFQKWIKKEDSFVFQLDSDDFKSVNLRPVRMIPMYSRSDIPGVFRELGIELLRNKDGGCLLIKTEKLKQPSLFPTLMEPQKIYKGLPFIPIPQLSVFKDKELQNEETGIHLGWALGIFQAFFIEIFSPYEEFFLGGRIRTKAKGNYIINSTNYAINTQVEADSYFESEKSIVVLESKFTPFDKPLKSFSLHQLLLPLVLIKSISEKPAKAIFMDFSMRIINEKVQLRFLLYLFSFFYKGANINPFSYNLENSKKYIIQF